MKYLLNCISFISLMILFSFFDNFGMKEEEEEKKEFKVVFVGDAGVGKTQIINNFLNNKFSEKYFPTIGASYYPKDIKYNGENIKLQLWDTAGLERYRILQKFIYKTSRLIVFVYAVDDKKSVDNIPNWVSVIKPQTNEKTKFLLVGNKCDLENKRQVSIQDGEDCANAKNMKFVEVSAKEGTNIENMFNSIIKEILDDMKKEKNKFIENTKKENIKINNHKINNLQDNNNSQKKNHNNNPSFCNKYCSCCHCL